MAEGEKILPINIEDEMKSAYIDYSMSVIVSRALPDVRDGMKPVHRRVLFGMHELGVRANTAHKKSARIVEKFWVNTTPTAILRYTTQWFVWLKNGVCVICSWTVKETLAQSMEIVLRQCVIRKPVCVKSLRIC